MTQTLTRPTRIRPTITVDISGMRISETPDDVLVTYSLGSCVGLTLYDPVAKVGGMIHCMLPLSRMDRRKALLAAADAAVAASESDKAPPV